jgi:phage tail protein X
MTYHTTALGETWDSIAYKEYGDATKVQALMQERENITLLDYEVFPSGVVVAVPALDEESTFDDDLPEWRRDDDDDDEEGE